MSVGSSLTFNDLLRSVWPTHTAKRAAGPFDRSYRTVENWLQQRCRPDADQLLRAAAENADLRAELVRLLGSFDGPADAHGRGAPALEEPFTALAHQPGSSDAAARSLAGAGGGQVGSAGHAHALRGAAR